MINTVEKQKEDQLVNVINNHIMPCVSIIGKKQKLIVVLDKITQKLSEKGIDYKHGKVLQRRVKKPLISNY
jgi:hypothetical protein